MRGPVLWLALAGCGNIRDGGGTAVGNPGKAVVRLAPDGDIPWDQATATDFRLEWVACDGWARAYPEATYDLRAGASFTVPRGRLCAVRVAFASLAASGDSSLALQSTEVRLPLEGLVATDADWVFELGEPAQPDAIRARSALFRISRAASATSSSVSCDSSPRSMRS